MTINLAAEANETQRLLLAPGAASTGVFQGRPGAFGTFPPTAKYTAQAMEALAKVAEHLAELAHALAAGLASVASLCVASLRARIARLARRLDRHSYAH